jgi:hypothetical protein
MIGTQTKRLFARVRVKHAAIVAMACGATMMLGGCAERRVHAFPWAKAAMIRPNVPTAQTSGSPDAADIAPDFRVESPGNTSRIFAPRPGPTRPRAATPAQPENGGAAKTHLLVPELSPQETAAAKQQFAESVTVVEKNLAAGRGKNLTAAQTDLVSKVNAFISEAREANGEGDWARARNLAKKAQILSEELVASF